MSTFKKGAWSEATNLGNTINTEYDDESPFIDAEGKTLYFSSKGHNVIGGFDVFKSTYDMEHKSWKAAVNLGYPINSTDDDLYFVVSGDNKSAYFASVKTEGYGDMDLYKMNFDPQEKKSKNISSIKLELTFKEKDTDKLLNPSVEIQNFSNKMKLAEGRANNGTFVFDWTDKSGAHEMYISCALEGFAFSGLKLDLLNETTVVKRTIYLEKIKPGVTIILRNIYYDFNKATLKESSFVELEKLIQFLKANPQVTIEISGHTDNVGSATFNKTLSLKRAESVYHWLSSKGIPNTRLRAAGYGELKPIASNDDEEEGRELNRRTEFTILQPY